MMKKYVVTLISLSGLLFTASLFADVKIGVVDIVEIMQQVPQIKKQLQADTAQLKKKLAPEVEEIKEAAETLKQNADLLQRNAAVMSPKEKSVAEKKLLQESQHLQELEEQHNQKLRKLQIETIQKIQSKIEMDVANIAKKKHYDFILQKQAIIYSKDADDITNQVVQKMK